MSHKSSPDLDRAGRSELHYAANTGDVDKASKLIAVGADVRLADANGRTPLHFAAQAQSVPVIELLLANGAEVDARDSHGNTPLSTATFSFRGDGGSIAVRRKAGADPHEVNNHGVSPVKLARTIANYDVAKHFADVAAELDVTE